MFKRDYNGTGVPVWYIRITSALIAIVIFCLIRAALSIKTGFILYLIFAVIGMGLLAACRCLRRTKHQTYPGWDYTRLYDRCARRSLNWISYTLWRLPVTLLNYWNIAVNSRAGEITLISFVEWLFWLIPAVLILTKLRIIRWIDCNYRPDKLPLFRRAVKRLLAASAVYWSAGAAFWYMCDRVFVLNAIELLSAIYFIGAAAFNIHSINGFSYSVKKYSRFLLAAVIGFLLVVFGYSYMAKEFWFTQPYINSVAYIYDGESRITYNDETAVYTITKTSGDFRILQLTDIHIGGSLLSYDKDDKALKAVIELLNQTCPDLVIVTGDLSYPVGISSFSFNNTAAVQQFAALMRNTGIPWAFTYGNHDTEAMASTTQESLNELYKSLSWKTSRTLMYPYSQPDISGRNNQLIELRNPDGTLNQAIFLLDSNAYIGKGFDRYDYIHDDQTEWYENEVLRLNAEEGRTVSSIAFFHIPLSEYNTAAELFKAGDESVKYFFGSNGEGISCSQYAGRFFETAVRLGSTKAMFCGHDHYNNMSLEYRGIRLTYGMSIDYLVEPGIARSDSQRGATLITLHDDSSFDISQVPLDLVD